MSQKLKNGGPSVFERSLRKLINKIGKKRRHDLSRFLARYSEIPLDSVFDPADFDWTGPIAEDWQKIRAEADQIMTLSKELPPLGDLSPDHARLDAKRSWRSFFMWGYGYRIDSNCRYAPVTTQLVEQVPGLLSAMFSVHEPGTHLVRHRGVTNGMITCHLGLDIPDAGEACRIEVNDQAYLWKNGQWFLFDDTQWHATWNEGDTKRVILLLHVKRPMRGLGKCVRDLFFFLIRRSPFIQEAKRNMRAWALRLEAAERKGLIKAPEPTPPV